MEPRPMPTIDRYAKAQPNTFLSVFSVRAEVNTPESAILKKLYMRANMEMITQCRPVNHPIKKENIALAKAKNTKIFFLPYLSAAYPDIIFATAPDK